MNAGAPGLKQDILTLLADKDWHDFDKILAAVGDNVMAERAVRFYCNMRPASESEPAQTEFPVAEKVRIGRRRAVYLDLKSLLKSGHIEVDGTREVNARRYRFAENQPKEPPAPPMEDKKRPSKTPKLRRNPLLPEPAAALLVIIDEAEAEFERHFSGSRDLREFVTGCRNLRRIVGWNHLCKDAATADPADPEVAQ